MNAAIFASSPDSAVADVITLVVWSFLALFALLLVWRQTATGRGAWLVVAFYCGVVAIDKAVDLQVAFYRFVKYCIEATDPWLGLRQHRQFSRVLLLVPMTAIAVGGTLWLVRRDQQLDHAKKLAIAGLVVVLLLVGMRLLPGVGWMLDERVGWLFEGMACLMIGWGVWRGWRLPRTRAEWYGDPSSGHFPR